MRFERRLAELAHSGGVFRLDQQPAHYVDPTDSTNPLALCPSADWSSNQRRSHPEFRTWKWAGVSASGIVCKSWTDWGARELIMAAEACSGVVCEFRVHEFTHLYDFRAPRCSANPHGGGGMTELFHLQVGEARQFAPAVRICTSRAAWNPVENRLLHELAHIIEMRNHKRGQHRHGELWQVTYAAMVEAYCSDASLPRRAEVRDWSKRALASAE